MDRRRRGGLRTEVLQRLWRSGPLGSAAIRESFDEDSRPALTTILTVLTRLEQDGLVRREAGPRGSLFAASQPEAQQLAGQMESLLTSAGDRRAVLSQFAGGLSSEDLAALRSMLDDS